MLSEQAKELLTGLVDGELDERSHRKAMLLLQQYPAAMEFLRNLQRDADRIKNLPAKTLGPKFQENVMREIVRRTEPAKLPMRRRSLKPYIAASLAASLLLGVLSGGLFHVLTREDDMRLPSGSFVFEKSKLRIPPVETPMQAPNPLIAEITASVFAQYAAPIPPDREFRVSFAELRKEGVATTGLSAELAKQKAVQLDVTVRNNTLAIRRLSEAFKDRETQLLVDASTAKAMAGKDAAKAELWVYAENLKTDEVAKILRELSQDDPNGKQFQASPYAKLMVASLESNQKAELAKRLGFADLSTMDKNATNNMMPQPKVELKAKERVAVVLPSDPSVGMNSEEVRRFLLNRRKASPGTVPVLIRIRVE